MTGPRPICGDVNRRWSRTCTRQPGHDGPHRECEITWPRNNSPAAEPSAVGERPAPPTDTGAGQPTSPPK